VAAPTLLLVGEFDDPVIDVNREAMARLDRAAVVELQLVPGATHLFEEPGTLEHAEHLAATWLERYLSS
jgi:pimeloyl-ACP methyl ester carboxylesterase